MLARPAAGSWPEARSRPGAGPPHGGPRPLGGRRTQRARGFHDPEPNLCRIDVVCPATTLIVATNGAKSPLRIDDLVPAFGEGQLGERRSRARRRAVDLDIAPGADRDLTVPVGRRSSRVRRDARSRSRALRAPWLRGLTCPWPIPAAADGDRRCAGRRRGLAAASACVPLNRRPGRRLGRLRRASAGQRRHRHDARQQQRFLGRRIVRPGRDRGRSWAAARASRCGGAVADRRHPLGSGRHRRRPSHVGAGRRKSSRDSMGASLRLRRAGGRRRELCHQTAVATAAIDGSDAAAIQRRRADAAAPDRRRRAPSRPSSRRPGLAGLSSSHWRSSRANERAERKRCSGSLAIARAAISASAFGTDGSTLFASGGSWFSTASRICASDSPRTAWCR